MIHQHLAGKRKSQESKHVGSPYMQAASLMSWIQGSSCIDVTSIKVPSAVWCGRRRGRENKRRRQSCREIRDPGLGEFDHGQPFHRDLLGWYALNHLPRAGAATSLPAMAAGARLGGSKSAARAAAVAHMRAMRSLRCGSTVSLGIGGLLRRRPFPDGAREGRPISPALPVGDQVGERASGSDHLAKLGRTVCYGRLGKTCPTNLLDDARGESCSPKEPGLNPRPQHPKQAR
jgi:hypothetical protein